MDDSTLGFFESILGVAPRGVKQIQLELDTEDVHGLFEFFLLFTTHSLGKWLGKPVAIEDIREKHIQLLAKYFASFGVLLTFKIENEPDVYFINNKAYLDKTVLEEMKFQLAAEGNLYTISFSMF